MSKFKKIFGLLLVVLVLGLLVACGPEDEGPGPEPGPGEEEKGVLTWSGLEDLLVAQGDRVDVLEGITVTDSKDGDISKDIFVLNDVDHEQILKDNGWYDDYEEFNPHILGNSKVYYGVENSTGVKEYKEKTFNIRLQHNVPNGDFSLGQVGWVLDIPGGTATVKYEDEKAKFNITNIGTEWWAIQLYSTVRFVSGETYRVTVKGSSAEGKGFAFGFEDASNNYAMLDNGVNVHKFTATSETYEYYFTADKDYTNVKAVLYLGSCYTTDFASAAKPATAVIEDIYIEKVKKNESVTFSGTSTVTLASGSFSLTNQAGKTPIDLKSYVTALQGTNDVTSKISLNGEVAENVLGNTGYNLQYVIKHEDGSVSFANKRFSVNLTRETPYSTINGEFDSGFAGWTADVNQTEGKGVALFEANQDGTITITMSKNSTAQWHMQLFQQGIKFEAGSIYIVKIKIKGANLDSKPGRVEIVDAANNFANIKNASIPFTTEWAEYTMEVAPTKAYSNIRVGFQFGTLPANAVIDIDYIKIEKLGQHNVSFDLDYEGAADPTVVPVNHGYLVSEPTDPVREGFNFTGWFLDGVEFEFTTPITEAIVLKAGWESKGSGADETAPTVDSVVFTKGVAAYQLVISAQDETALKGINLNSSLATLLTINGFRADANPYASEEDKTALEALGIAVSYSVSGDSRVWTVDFTGAAALAISNNGASLDFYLVVEDLAGNKFGSTPPTSSNTYSFTVVAISYYNVTFDGDDSQSLIEGSKITKPETDPTKPNAKFFRWETAAGVAWNFNTAISDDVALVSVFGDNENDLFENPSTGFYLVGDKAYQVNGGDQSVFFKGVTGNYYVAQTTVTLNGRLNGDNYPKVGVIVAKGEDASEKVNELFFFFDPGAVKNNRLNVSTAARLNGAWSWNYKSGEKTIGGINFNEKLEITFIRNNTEIWAFVDGELVSYYTGADVTGDTQVGLYTINYDAVYENSSITVTKAAVDAYLADFIFANDNGWSGVGPFTVNSASSVVLNGGTYQTNIAAASLGRSEVLTGDFFIEYKASNIKSFAQDWPKISLLLKRADNSRDDNISIGAAVSKNKRLETNLGSWKNWAGMPADANYETGITVRIERTVVDATATLKLYINGVVQTVDSVEYATLSYVGDYTMRFYLENSSCVITDFSFGTIV